MEEKNMRKVFKKALAVTMAATMVVGLAACGSSESSDKGASKSDQIKIGVSIWSSTDVLGSQCKKMLDEAAKALDVKLQYVDQGHVSEKVTASVETLAAAGCQGIIICNSSDTEMTSAIKTCNDNKVYLSQFFHFTHCLFQYGFSFRVCHDFSHCGIEGIHFRQDGF